MTQPLAERIRPKSLNDYISQQHLVGEKGILTNHIKQGIIPSLILWGPPGIGKTTLANIIANESGRPFYTLSAISSGVKDVREVIEKAKKSGGLFTQKNPILFIDEIHRFSKSQQDSLLGAVEKGWVTLIGATTENPSFEVIPALLSRCQVYILNSFDKEDLTTTLLDIDRSSGGYYIKWLQPHMHLLKDKDEVLDEQIKFIKKDIEVLSKTVYNDDAKFFGKEPLRVVAKGKSNSFVEKAGNNYLLKVGEFIGQQSEMYQEKERQQPMEAYYRKDYHRVITVTIPEGYTIKNLEEINLNESFNKEEKELMKFESTYTLDGNILTITADEFYDFIRLEKKFFNDYRRVMNAAADFNKVTLILEKN